MSRVYSGIEFKYTFRDYQKKVLDSCQKLMDDRRIHIVAAPGSGKTVLGLELIKRLDSPVLILVPTINLREQWIERLFEGFVSDEEADIWNARISNDLTSLNVINCVTYQALFSFLQDNTAETLVDMLKSKGVKTICLDEAHHLRNEWWKALESVVELLNKDVMPVIIALTATPPYDSDSREWLRYSKLCGEIDIEINAPSMVKNKCICPYQDYIYMCVPDENESKKIEMILSDKKKRMNKVLKSKEFYDAVMKHKGLADIETNADVFMSNPDYLNAIIDYINSYATYLRYDFEDGREAARKAFDGVDASIKELINTDLEQKQLTKKQLKSQFFISEEKFFILMDGIINKDSHSYDETFLINLKEQLTHLAFFRDGKLVKKRSEEQVGEILKNSVSLYDGIVDVVNSERACLQDKMRCLVLTDRVRKESFTHVQTTNALGEQGCVSIWETLRRNEHLRNINNYMNSQDERCTDIGMLTANIAILPKRLVSDAKSEDIKETGYVRIDITDSDRKRIISDITNLFNQGEIKVLIGTVALLGEGWDAPCVNSVVIASNLATYVQTNQIRGRGFRMNKSWPDKTANIWHLFCMKPILSDSDNDISDNTSSQVITGYEPGINSESLFHRFDTIIGISHDGKRVSSGINRVMQVRDRYSKDDLEMINNDTKHLAADRKALYENWISFTEQNNVDDIQYVVNVAKDVKSLKKSDKINLFETLRRRYFKDKSFNRSRITANVVIAAMKKAKLIDDNVRLDIKYDRENYTTGVRLSNATNPENQLFTKTMEEILGKEINTRYLIKDVSFLNKRYIAVPSAFDKNKQLAGMFFEELVKHKPVLNFSKPKLIYTQTTEGKTHLVRARLENLEKKDIKVFKYYLLK